MQTAGFVLAGGRSRRMGTDKALLEIDGVTLAAKVACEVREAAGSAALIGPANRYGHLGLPVIADLHPGLGPLAGIETALSQTKAEWNLIVACDLPGVTARFLRSLLECAARNPDLEVVASEDAGGRVQPLCAVYRRTALPLITSRVQSGHLKLLETIPLLRMRTVRGTVEQLRNVNTPTDWAEAGGRRG